MFGAGFGTTWQLWLDLSYFNGAPLTFKENFEKTKAFISTQVLGQWQEFYFGITGRLSLHDEYGRCIQNRWNANGFGHCWHGYQKMILLYASPHSNKAIHDASGKMEDDFITIYRHLPGCQNEKGGGGGAADKSPSFCYLAVR